MLSTFSLLQEQDAFLDTDILKCHLQIYHFEIFLAENIHNDTSARSFKIRVSHISVKIKLHDFL